LKPEIDLSLTQSEPMSFGCTPWRIAATKLADRHHLSLRIENGIMYVSRK
jgi:predicted transcriptional regulator